MSLRGYCEPVRPQPRSLPRSPAVFRVGCSVFLAPFPRKIVQLLEPAVMAEPGEWGNRVRDRVWDWYLQCLGGIVSSLLLSACMLLPSPVAKAGVLVAVVVSVGLAIRMAPPVPRVLHFFHHIWTACCPWPPNIVSATDAAAPNSGSSAHKLEHPGHHVLIVDEMKSQPEHSKPPVTQLRLESVAVQGKPEILKKLSDYRLPES